MWIIVAVPVVAIVALWLGTGVRVVRETQRGVVFRLARPLPGARDPGTAFLVPFIDRMIKVDVNPTTITVAGQRCTTCDDVVVLIDASARVKVVDPHTALLAISDYRVGVEQLVHTALRSVVGERDADDLLDDTESVRDAVMAIVEPPILSWGVRVDQITVAGIRRE